MDQLILEKVIEYIQNLWKSHNSNYELEGIWLALHETVSMEYVCEPNTPVIRAWLIRNNSIEEKKPIDYIVFMKLGLESKKIYTIAYSNTALIKESSPIYMGYQLGGLYGRGLLFDFDKSVKLEEKRMLWVS